MHFVLGALAVVALFGVAFGANAAKIVAGVFACCVGAVGIAFVLAVVAVFTGYIQ